jgi:predicted porin
LIEGWLRVSQGVFTGNSLDPYLTLEKLAMKKSLIALAVLAASGASFAQSSVTVFGTFDPSFASQNTTYVDGDSVRQNLVRNNSQGTSQVTFKGVEDLGGGLKASFLIENDFDAGLKADNNFSSKGGELYTGLEGSFGAIKLGAPNTPTLTAQAASQPFGTKIGSGFGIVNSGKVRNSNTVMYATPAMNGFSAAVAFSNKTKLDADAATPITAETASITDFGVNYANGPVAAGFSIYKVAATTTPSAASKTDNNVYVTYDMGVAKLGAGYFTQKKEGSVDAKGYNVSAVVPMSANLSLLANFAKLDDTMAGTNLDRQVSAVGVKYTLSARTSVYARYVAEKNDNVTVAHGIKEVTTALVGVQHNF